LILDRALFLLVSHTVVSDTRKPSFLTLYIYTPASPGRRISRQMPLPS